MFVLETAKECLTIFFFIFDGDDDDDYLHKQNPKVT